MLCFSRPFFAIPSAPYPKHGSNPTQCCQLDHANESQSPLAFANYKGVQQVDEMVSGLLYIDAVPVSKVRVGLCHSIAGRAGDGGP